MEESDTLELSMSDFTDSWQEHYDAVFTDLDFDKRPFLQHEWRQFCIGSPAYYFEDLRAIVSAQQSKHLELYVALQEAITAMGDTEIVGFLRGGPHSNPSILRSSRPFARAMYRMRLRAIDGFDLHIFGKSETWGVVVSWEEELALAGGNPDFVEAFERRAGGEVEIRKNFEWATAYLHDVGTEQRALAAHLRSICFPE